MAHRSAEILGLEVNEFLPNLQGVSKKTSGLCMYLIMPYFTAKEFVAIFQRSI
jgi:hypothetical protein